MPFHVTTVKHRDGDEFKIFFMIWKLIYQSNTNPSWKIGNPEWYKHTSESLAGPLKL